MSYLNNLPPVSKQQEEDEDAIRSMASNLRVLSEGIRNYEGKIWGFDIALNQDSAPTFIDFLRIQNCINVPTGTPLRIPGRLLYAVILTNMGGGNVKYSIGTDVGEGGSVVLLNGQQKEHRSGRAKYSSATVRAIGAATTVNVGFEL